MSVVRNVQEQTCGGGVNPLLAGHTQSVIREIWAGHTYWGPLEGHHHHLFIITDPPLISFHYLLVINIIIGQSSSFIIRHHWSTAGHTASLNVVEYMTTVTMGEGESSDNGTNLPG